MSTAVLPKLAFTRTSGRPIPVARTTERPAETIPVQCEHDIVDAICLAHERMCAVRPIGGMGSKNDCHATNGLSLDPTADGRVLAVGHAGPDFDHAIVSMGMLGVISTVTFACEPAFDLELETRVIPFDRYLRDHAALDAANKLFASV